MSASIRSSSSVHPRRRRVGRGVGERDTDVLGLGAVDLVTEDPAAAAEALAVAALAAEAAGAARGDARHEHLVADLHVLHARSDLFDGADGLVTEDAAVGHRGHVALQDVQVGAADRHRVDANDRVGVRLQTSASALPPTPSCRDRGTREPSSQPPGAVVDPRIVWQEATIRPEANVPVRTPCGSDWLECTTVVRGDPGPKVPWIGARPFWPPEDQGLIEKV